MSERYRSAAKRLSTVGLSVLLFAVQRSDDIHAAGAAVVWVNLVNAIVSGDVLQKVAVCDGCQDAGAASMQQITSGDGAIEFTIGETNTLFAAGLSHLNSNTTYADIDFAFRFNGAGWADVLENDIYVGGDTPYSVGDVFRIALAGGNVRYSRNGVVVLERTKTLQYPYELDTSLLTIGATIGHATIKSIAPSAAGGFLEKAGLQAYRPRLTVSLIAAFLPPGGATGRFTFPAPYNTEGVRLTNAADCAGGADCLWYVGYSYWRNTNSDAGSDTMYILLGFDRNRGGAGPSLIAYNKATNQVQNLGPLFADNYSYATGEGWYFSATMPSRLYTFLPGGTRLRRFDVLTRQFEATPALDLSQCPRPGVCPSNAAFINQPHSSDDDSVHSVTVQDASFQRLGCAVYRPAGFVYVPIQSGYALDECHVDKSGQWLMMLEAQASTGKLDNRIIDLSTGNVVSLADVEGALGHLDMGFGYAVGADNYNTSPNASILLKFPLAGTTRPVGPVVHFNKRWDIAAANHVAHGNAIPGRAPEEQYACGSNASRVADMADEIVCFSLNPNRNTDGSLDVLVAAPVMTDLNAPGGGGGDYEKMPKGNLDVTGRYFIWTTNLGGNRLDAFLLKVPADLLAGSASSTPVAANKTATTPSSAAVSVTLSATDIETCELGFALASSPGNGTLSGLTDQICAPGSPNTDTAQITYTPNAGFSGTDSFTYRATDGTATSAVATVTITVTSPQTSSHIGDLDGSGMSLGGGKWRAMVSVQVHTTSHAIVAGALVAGVWTGGYSGTMSCTTDGNGRCSVQTGSVRRDKLTATFAVTGIQHATLLYDAPANHDPDGDSGGTAITVRKP